MTPADQLQAAAQILRERANTASQPHGPVWVYRTRHPESGTVEAGHHTLIHGSANGGRIQPFVDRTHGQWIATVDPALGLLIADWLETTTADDHALAVAVAVADQILTAPIEPPPTLPQPPIALCDLPDCILGADHTNPHLLVPKPKNPDHPAQ
ncbi:hypothetical protein [Kitasatospora mediocidica]|uniref:hypothetical protein n=1 Tax=Kitasatospora mediocidica TaxID=58352 RepID=UPI00056D7BB0|nr:hypothetical protein [Kitasatospora mediocidica]